jgi:hypothetical protein
MWEFIIIDGSPQIDDAPELCANCHDSIEPGDPALTFWGFGPLCSECHSEHERDYGPGGDYAPGGPHYPHAD